MYLYDRRKSNTMEKVGPKLPFLVLCTARDTMEEMGS